MNLALALGDLGQRDRARALLGQARRVLEEKSPEYAEALRGAGRTEEADRVGADAKAMRARITAREAMVSGK